MKADRQRFSDRQTPNSRRRILCIAPCQQGTWSRLQSCSRAPLWRRDPRWVPPLAGIHYRIGRERPSVASGQQLGDRGSSVQSPGSSRSPHRQHPLHRRRQHHVSPRTPTHFLDQERRHLVTGFHLGLLRRRCWERKGDQGNVHACRGRLRSAWAGDTGSKSKAIQTSLRRKDPIFETNDSTAVNSTIPVVGAKLSMQAKIHTDCAHGTFRNLRQELPDLALATRCRAVAVYEQTSS